jgi:hypothetical protein
MSGKEEEWKKNKRGSIAVPSRTLKAGHLRLQSGGDKSRHLQVSDASLMI